VETNLIERSQNAIAKNLENLVSILQLAYSGELAAALAYNGHWHSVKKSEERERILQIENEEWHHRKLVGDMLLQVGRQPDPDKETQARRRGRVLAFLCHIAGWFAPMYAAGKLESRNIREYELAARYALNSGHPEFVDYLLTMAEVEWEHERYFRSRAMLHPFAKWIRIWEIPPEKDQIRRSFLLEAESTFLKPNV
jgi:hypothetical protein